MKYEVNIITRKCLKTVLNIVNFMVFFGDLVVVYTMEVTLIFTSTAVAFRGPY